jgi:hypothetical protein
MTYDNAGSVYAIGARFTHLDSTGAPLAGAGNAYVTQALVTAGLGLEYTDGEEISQRNGAGQVCVSYRAPDSLARGTVSDLQFCSPDPNILAFLMGGSVITRAGIAEVQTITITGTPTGGTFTLTFDGQTTAGIAYNAAAAAVQSALEALSNLAPGDVTVTGGPGPGTPWVATFLSTLGNIPQMSASGTGLTGGTTPAVAVTTNTGGSNLTDIGYRAPAVGSDPMPNGVSVELWSRATVDGAFSSDLPYIHWVVARAFLRPSDDFTLSAEDALTPTFEGFSNQNANWGDGPEGDWAFQSDRVWQYARKATAPDFTRGLITVT